MTNPGPYTIPQPEEITSVEKEDAMSSYLMMFVTWIIGLPIPFLSVLACAIFYFLNRRKSRFVAFHAYQNLLVNVFTSSINVVMVVWLIVCIITEVYSKAFAIAAVLVVLLNIWYGVTGVLASIRARKGRFYYQWIFGRWAYQKYYGPQAQPLEQPEIRNTPPPGL